MFKIEKENGIARLVFNRPEKRNTMNFDFFLGLVEAFEGFDDDPEVRVVVITAEGPSFTAGLDLNSLAGVIESDKADAREELRRLILRGQESMNAIEACRKPVVAAVHGHCIGGGVDLLCACDIRLASRDAVFAVRETKIALVADVGTLQRLPFIVGHGWARELCLTGRDFSAEEARNIGFITHLTENREELVKKAEELAREIAANSPLAVQGVKDVMAYSKEFGVRAGLQYVAQKNAAILLCEDLMEAMASFMEKRPPKFKGR